MKKIEVSDEDYEVLMELSKELQLQENDGQAFPYFWEPYSEKTVRGHEDDQKMIYDCGFAEVYSAKEYAENNDEMFSEFLESEGVDKSFTYEQAEEDGSIYDLESDWLDFAVDKLKGDGDIVYQKTEKISEHNPSLFKSDVKGFCKSNSHHLGKNPNTYARTIWRMPKMVSLVKALYRLNPQENINEEANGYVKNGKYKI